MEAYEPLPNDIALANDRIVARVQERLRQRQGTIFESPDGDCVVVQIYDVRTDPRTDMGPVSGQHD